MAHPIAVADGKQPPAWRYGDRPTHALSGKQSLALTSLSVAAVIGTEDAAAAALGKLDPVAVVALVHWLLGFGNHAAQHADRATDALAHIDTAAAAGREAELLRQLTAAQVTIKAVKASVTCPICGDIALLPIVLGACGHIACHTCLKHLDDVAFSHLVSSVGGASARQHLLARRCPLCRSEIIGAGLPCHPLRAIASTLASDGWVDASELGSLPRGTDLKEVRYEVDTAESRHVAALQIGCYAQAQLAIHSVGGLEAMITPEQWRRGVYVVFEQSVSRVFFETFATTMQGRAGGVHVLVNAGQRMLAVQLIDRTRDKSDPGTGGGAGHLLIRVGTDGRFTVTAAPDPRTTPVLSILPAPASAAIPAAATASASAAVSVSGAALPAPPKPAPWHATVFDSTNALDEAVPAVPTPRTSHA